MAVELILMENVDNLGTIGDLVKVTDGYARNYLIPRKLAAKASPGAMRQLEAKKKQLQVEYEGQIATAKELAEQITKASVTLPVQAADDEKLFGSITSKQIGDALAEMNIHVDRRKIALAEPIRQLGVYSVELHLHPEVTATLKVWIVRA
jgi:large subunit ribosomal protein L9